MTAPLSRRSPIAPTAPVLCALAACVLTALTPASTAAEAADLATTVTVAPFGTTPEGEAVEAFEMRNAQGLTARVITYGATLISLSVPDRDGRFDDIALGFDTLEECLNKNFGGTTGRFANRIGGARFPLDDQMVTVTANAGRHHIHGGRRGFSAVVWQGEAVADADGTGPAVRFTYVSADGEEGYPGTLTCVVTYRLTSDNALSIAYEATTDKPTVINLTNHGYYNLAGAGAGNVHDHVLWIDADHYTPADADLIPTGELATVRDTALDFTTPRRLGERIDTLTATNGYDHNYAFKEWDGRLALRARVYEPGSGRVMEVSTTEPGVQLYTANHLRGLAGRDGKTYERHGGFCLETQHFPDSPNKPAFPSTVLRPGEVFRSETVHRFATRGEGTIAPGQ